MKLFNICAYGASTCDRLQTRYIQDAIDACFLAGGGRVVIPAGVYVTGGLRIRSNVELYLECGAILKGSRNPEDYFGYLSDTLEPVTPEESAPNACPSTNPTSRWCNALIRAFDAHDFAVVGEKGSFLDGDNCFDPQGEEKYRGPHGMTFWRCENIRLEGYTFINSGNWCHAIFQSKHITLRGVTVLGGHDGLDLRTCDDVRVENCNFSSGDDAIAGFDNHDVVIRDCILNTACSGLRFGGNNVLMEHCTSTAAPFGLRKGLSIEEKRAGLLPDENCRHKMNSPFTYYCDYRAPLRRPAENITIRGCRFAQASELIRLEFTGLHRWCSVRSLRQIKFEDCSMEDLNYPGMLWGDKNEKVICHFKNVKIACKPGCEQVPLFAAGNFEAIIFEDCTIEGYADPTILVGTPGEGEVELIRSTPITVKNVTFEDCLAAHTTGICAADLVNGQVAVRDGQWRWTVGQSDA